MQSVYSIAPADRACRFGNIIIDNGVGGYFQKIKLSDIFQHKLCASYKIRIISRKYFCLFVTFDSHPIREEVDTVCHIQNIIWSRKA